MSEGVAKKAKTMPVGQGNEKVIIYKMGMKVPKDVTKVVFDSSVTKVKERAFEGCTKLKEVTLNEGLKSIGKCAFRGCESLRSIKLPSTATEVEARAFQYCTNLKEAVLNEGG